MTASSALKAAAAAESAQGGVCAGCPTETCESQSSPIQFATYSLFLRHRTRSRIEHHISGARNLALHQRCKLAGLLQRSRDVVALDFMSHHGHISTATCAAGK